MDVQITYETLFDLLRKERSLEELQSLDDVFWSQVVGFVNNRKNFFERTNSLEQEKVRIQLQNINRILKEIYERREKKIVSLALNIVKTDNTAFADKRNMLPSEKEFFDEVIDLLIKYKQGILLQVFQGRTPLIAPVKLPLVSSDTSQETVSSDSTVSSSDSTHDDSTKLPETNSSENSTTSNNASSEGSDLPEMKEGTMLVRFKVDVPKFLGRNKQIFGPFSKGTIVQLPVKIAQILLKKSKVDSVMGSD